MATASPVPTHDHQAQGGDRREDLAPGELADEDEQGATFVHMRLRLQQGIRALNEAHEQGLALDMAIAAEDLEAAAVALAASVRALVARKASVEAQVQTALYECDALHDVIADLFEACLRPSSPRASPGRPQDLSPTESYPWLRRCLEHYAALIERTLSTWKA